MQLLLKTTFWNWISYFDKSNGCHTYSWTWFLVWESSCCHDQSNSTKWMCQLHSFENNEHWFHSHNWDNSMDFVPILEDYRRNLAMKFLLQITTNNGGFDWISCLHAHVCISVLEGELVTNVEIPDISWKWKIDEFEYFEWWKDLPLQVLDRIDPWISVGRSGNKPLSVDFFNYWMNFCLTAASDCFLKFTLNLFSK